MNNAILTIFSYKCDDYVSNDTETEAIDKIRQSIMKISKSEDADSNIGQNEESSKDGSEVSGNSVHDAQPPSPVQSDDTRMPDNVLIVNCADIPNIISSTSETSDIKSTKTTKVWLLFFSINSYYYPLMCVLNFN